MKHTKQIKKLGLAGLFSIAFVACGGGGDGGGGGAGSVTYTGNTDPAEITEANSREIASSSSSAGSATPINPVAAESSSYDKGSFVMQTLKHHSKVLSQSIGADANAFGNNPGVAVTVNESALCPTTGSISLTGTIDDETFIGNLTYTYNNCSDGTITINGSLGFNIVAYDLTIDEVTDGTFTYNNLHFTSNDPADGIDWQIGATFHAQLFYSGNFNPYTERATIDMAIVDNVSGESLQFENFVTEIVYNSYFSPSSRTESINGRFYEHVHGYVDIETVSPLVYTVNSQNYPDAGGPMIFTGADNKKIKITPVSSTMVRLEADTDGDDFYEYSITLPWTSLNSAEINVNAPTANAGADASISLGATAQLDASSSSDADFNLITFSWTVIDQPAASNANLAGANASNATITPDTAGTYTLQVEVSDGTFSSTDTVIITVLN